MHLVERAARKALGLLRTPSRGTTFVMPEFMGFGNLLPTLAWAHTSREHGRSVSATRTGKGEYWYERLPHLAELTVEHSSLSLLDHRSTFEQTPRLFSDELPRTAVEGFITERIRPFELIADLPEAERFADDGHITLNIRRGDYYSDPGARGMFGFDTPAYIGEALRLAQDQAPITGIHVVSDGIDWCRERLPWLADVAPTTYSTQGDPLRDLATLCASRRIICTNTTFAFWGAHCSSTVFGDNHALVWVPRFFWRQPGPSDPQDDRWSVVETIPGGWDS